MSPLGPWSIILIAIVALLIFGPKKLPELGKAFGSSLREFKNATKGLAEDDDIIDVSLLWEGLRGGLLHREKRRARACSPRAVDGGGVGGSDGGRDSG